jgi:polysaccharide pyruvyl transferase CsaB
LKKILISGYYGFNNSGDEAILQVIVDNLRAKIPGVEITVLSHAPEDTVSRYGVRAVKRMSPTAILREVARCDLLLSGGGSLLQDATSQRSLLYYLTIIRLAQLLGKKVFIYSQGIGPINGEKNRVRTAKCLRKVDGIVVRDGKSKQLLQEIGVDPQEVYVTSDPVLRAKRPDLSLGAQVLEREHCPRRPGRTLIGWAVREGAGESGFTKAAEAAIRWLQQERNADVVLLPFHYHQDIQVARGIQSRGENLGLVENQYLSEDMLSVVGNLDLLVGARLHSLIYSAVMDVPMIGVSYDPKIDSFLNAIGMNFDLTVDNFTLEGFQHIYDHVVEHYDSLRRQVGENVSRMQQDLGLNEELICQLLGVNQGEKEN